MTLVDTGPLVALCDARDAKHRTAATQLRAVAGGGMAVCDAVLCETCFHLPHLPQRQRLHALLRDLRIRPAAVDDEWTFRLDVFDWLATYADHEPDWADGCLAVLSGHNPKVKIWSFDREFRTTWRRPNGTPIPLAMK